MDFRIICCVAKLVKRIDEFDLDVRNESFFQNIDEMQTLMNFNAPLYESISLTKATKLQNVFLFS